MTIYGASGTEFDVNSTYSRTQAQSDAASLAGGGAILVWVDADFNTTAGRFLKAQIYGADGARLGTEMTLVAGSSFINPAVTGLEDGRFVLTWEGLTSVQAQVFDATGAPVAPAFTVSPAGISADRPDVTALDGGGFAISWHDTRTSGGDISGFSVHVRSYDANGAAIAPESLVNVVSNGNQADSAITALSGGGYVVTFTDRGAGWLIKGRIYDASGAAVGSEFIVSTATSGVSSVESSVTTLANGGFAVAWYESDAVLGSGHRIQLFSASGDRIGSQITVPSGFSGTQVGPKVASLADGGFAIAWTANSTPLSDGSGRAVFVQVFDAGGQAAGDARLVNNQASGDQFDPSITALGSGGFIVSWTDLGGAGADDDQVKARVFTPQYPVTITSDGGGDVASVMAAENQSIVTQVVATTDGSPADIRYSIDGGDDAALFTIDPLSGILSFANAPDHEYPGGDGDNLYSVRVRAGNAVYGDVQTLSVSVTNVNEAPVISSHGGSTSVALSRPENALAVTTITATDVDGDAVHFAITGGPDAALFAIDAQSGVLSFVNAPDFEAPVDFAEDNFYTVIVSASDGTLSAMQRVEIVVEDVNEAVRITSYGGTETVSLAIQENGQAAADVRANDPDGDAISYTVTGGADAALFAIDAATGALRFKSAPDFEAPSDVDRNNSYDVIVSASDGSLSATQRFAIAVQNDNEVARITSFGGTDAVSLIVNENQQAAALIAAADPDGDAISYAVTGGADAALFSIDPATGALRFNSAPDFEAPADAGLNNVYDVVISASDGHLSDSQTLAVTVSDVPEAATIIGTAGNDIISTSRTVAGQSFATIYNDRIEGRGGADTISGGAGNDSLDGGAGNDRLAGEAGADILTGGLGTDIFEFGAAGDSRAGTSDRITDFSRQQGDIISLASIDAKVATSANEAFKFIGTKTFSREAGQLRYDQAGGSTSVYGDVNGDGIADFQIEILGSVKFAAADFIL
ncbi:hypothetical protein [Sphingobium sp. 15-1]|uniref:M10 family metallopeptidase C-terminal domain-containing protein n=1 Tax=Sphingobium sp. 15-1 TaxID=2729616 RepID=UPI00159C81C3|nr:hypothetical protein [Sphingobium sp. 15-1]